MKKNRLASIFAVLALLAGFTSFPAGKTYAQGSRFFTETGHTVKGKFLQYWNEHGSLPQQGYPISEELQEVSDTDGKTYTMQYFQRAVFEQHPEFAGTPNEVLLSLLGVFFYNARYAGSAPAQHTSTDNPRLFNETGFTSGGAFRRYWETHGGLAQQGYPISEEFQEVNDTDGKTYTVQYYQRAVFEYHPEYAGTESEVLLSLLGVFNYNKKHQGSSGGNPPGQPPITAVVVPGWTHVVASTNNVVLFYNSNSGTGVTARVGADGTLSPLQKFPDAAAGNVNFSTGWTHIVAGPGNLLFFYNQATGLAAIVSVGEQGIDKQLRTQQFATGWTNISIDPESGKMLFYKKTNTTAYLYVAKLTPDGSYIDIKHHEDAVSPSAFPWSQFVPVGGGRWLWYVQANGNGLVATVNDDGSFSTLQSYTTFSRSWTHIVSDLSNMVFYDKTNGVVVTAQIGLGDAFQSLKTYSGISTSWTNVLATNNNVFLFYSGSTGDIATDAVSNNGNETALQRYKP